MKFPFVALIMAALPLLQLHAQTDTTSAAPASRPSPIDVLTPTEKAQLSAAHDKALAQDPALMQQEYALKSQADAFQVSPPVPAAKEKFMEIFAEYRKKLEVGMLKADPTIQPLLDKLHAAQASLRSASAPAAAPAPTPSSPSQ